MGRCTDPRFALTGAENGTRTVSARHRNGKSRCLLLPICRVQSLAEPRLLGKREGVAIVYSVRVDRWRTRCSWRASASFFWSSLTVLSSSALISDSLTAFVIFVGLPLPAHRAMPPVRFERRTRPFPSRREA